MPDGVRTIFTGPGQVELEPQKWQSPGPGQALIRTERTLISTGTELTGLTGDYPPDSRWAAYMNYPVAVGYSSAGRVAELGEGVDRLQVGDRVVSMGPHATYALISPGHAWKVPEEVDPEAASFATLAEIAMGGVRRGRLAFGESVVIVGAGLVGQLAAHFCRRAGAWPVILVDTAAGRLETARDCMGATHVIPRTADEARPEVDAWTRGRMADVVFEVTGNAQAIVGALKLARKLGRVVVLGSPRGPVTVDFHEEVHSLGLEIIGAHNQAHPPVETPHTPWTISRHIELFLDWQAAGIIDVTPLITHRYPWQQTPAAYAMLLADRSQALGVVLDWSSD